MKNLKYLAVLPFLAIIVGSLVFISSKNKDTSLASPLGAVNAIASMQEERAVHTSTLLPNGKVLIAGGFDSKETFKTSAELFNPVTSTFEYTGQMHGKRAGHSAVLLNDGKVLVIGGIVGNIDTYSKRAELYDPETGKFSLGGAMQIPRMSCSATLLSDGRVLVAGGLEGNNPTASMEIYNPKTDAFQSAGKMEKLMGTNQAFLLKSGKVLLIGQNLVAELFDPTTGTSEALPAIPEQEVAYKYAATLLPDEKLMIAGGSDTRDWNGKLRSTIIYDFQQNRITPTGNMHLPRFKHGNATVLLENGNVFVAGGGDFAELYQTSQRTFSQIAGNYQKTLQYATATLLQDNRILITGGYEENIVCAKEAWIYEPAIVN